MTNQLYTVQQDGLSCKAVNNNEEYLSVADQIYLNVNIEWEKFEANNPILPLTTKHEPGAEIEGRIVWQYRTNMDLVVCGFHKEIIWKTGEEYRIKELYNGIPDAMRQAIEPITPTNVSYQVDEGKESPKIHYLKTWQPYFDDVKADKKKFEVRKNDRDFRVGDLVVLKEYNPHTNEFTNRSIQKEIIYILHGGNFGIEDGYCVIQML